jgi:NhaP-type Na+/H+ or K+/H+ antiporter
MGHVLLFAFFNVIVTAVALIPFMLYVLDLAAAGWRPIDVAVFAAMLAATDAVAVAAILKAGEQLTGMVAGMVLACTAR